MLEKIYLSAVDFEQKYNSLVLRISNLGKHATFESELDESHKYYQQGEFDQANSIIQKIEDDLLDIDSRSFFSSEKIPMFEMIKNNISKILFSALVLVTS